jgi:1,4-dihydroxy-2-naphthoate octaprenyltransferase
MTSRESTGLPEPSAAAFASSHLGTRFKRLLLATRPAFFPASVAPVIVGSAWGYRVAGSLDWIVFGLALVSTLCVHLAANVLNDVGDDISGADRVNSARIFPYTGGSRFIQNGIMSVREMLVLAAVLLAIAVLPGIALIELRGPAVLLFGIAGVLLGVLYSLPRVQLSAHGVGEAVIAVAFGMLPVTGAAWLQSGRLDLSAVLISVPVSLWVAAILLMNEVPDRAADAQVGKRTLAVRLGVTGTRRLYFSLQLTAALSFLLAGVLSLVPWWMAALVLFLLPPAWKAAQGIHESSNRDRLTRSIELTLRLHTAGVALLLVAVVLGKLLYTDRV